MIRNVTNLQIDRPVVMLREDEYEMLKRRAEFDPMSWFKGDDGKPTLCIGKTWGLHPLTYIDTFEKADDVKFDEIVIVKDGTFEAVARFKRIDERDNAKEME